MSTSNAASTVNPTATAEQVGKRFLKLIDRLNVRGNISLGQLAEAMEVPVGQMEPRHNGYSAALPIGEGWLYALDLWQDTASSPWASIILQFDNEELHEYADFAPICGMPFAKYRDAFKASGYQEKLDYGDAGKLLAANYVADNFFVIVKFGLKNAEDDKSHPSCVRRIELMNRKAGG
ncbi:MAG: hypothetical protein ACREP7_06890 [Lysobacter sp.]